MAGAIRAIEELAGKQFIYYEDIPKVSPYAQKKEAWKEEWIEENTLEVEISKSEGFETVYVEVKDKNSIVGETVSYKLEGENVIKVRKPVYSTRTVPKSRLREGVRFCTETGRFFETKVPTDQEAELAASTGFELGLSQWIRDRM